MILRRVPPGRRTPRDRRAIVDLLVLAALCAVAAGLAAWLRPIDRLLGAAPSTDGPVADAVLTLLLVLPVATTVFARRRYHEAIVVRRELMRLSLHDALTGLPNRRLLLDWLTSDIEASQARNSQTAVLFIDLDRFKYVNDTHGHEVGDRLMQAVAQRLSDVVSERGRLIRYGGDEFVVIAPDLNNNSAEKLAQQLIRVVELPFMVANETLSISASVGVALAEHRGFHPDAVIRDADAAMYQAKLRGSGQVVTFDRSMTSRLTPATAELQIRAALEAGEFHLYYQPVVDLQTGHIVGAEALLRWISEERGTMSPGEFIPILEETGLIVPVGTWVLGEACRQATRLSSMYPDAPITVSVNVAARQIAQAGFVDTVSEALRSAGAEPGQIHLEITEGAIMSDVDSAWTALREVKSLGVKLALDDFGTGYSSLSYLRRFSLDMLKIDKSFIDGIVSSREDRAIVHHVVGMAHALGAVTVAEGVEHPEQVQVLRELGCQTVQGYVMSRPIPAGDLERLIAVRRNEPFAVGVVDLTDSAPPPQPRVVEPAMPPLTGPPLHGPVLPAGQSTPAPRGDVTEPERQLPRFRRHVPPDGSGGQVERPA